MVEKPGYHLASWHGARADIGSARQQRARGEGAKIWAAASGPFWGAAPAEGGRDRRNSEATEATSGKAQSTLSSFE
jgi:hypothetical protein